MDKELLKGRNLNYDNQWEYGSCLIGNFPPPLKTTALLWPTFYKITIQDGEAEEERIVIFTFFEGDLWIPNELYTHREVVICREATASEGLIVATFKHLATKVDQL